MKSTIREPTSTRLELRYPNGREVLVYQCRNSCSPSVPVYEFSIQFPRAFYRTALESMIKGHKRNTWVQNHVPNNRENLLPKAVHRCGQKLERAWSRTELSLK